MSADVSGSRDAEDTPLALVALLVERWPLLLGAMLLAASLVVATRMLVVPRRFEASTTLAAVSADRLPSSLGGLAALSGLSADGSFAATPDLLAQLLQSRRVLLEVATSPVAAGLDSVRLIDALAAGGQPPHRLVDVERTMRQSISVTVERRTGLIALVVRHRDTALARSVNERIVEAAGSTFASLTAAQARVQRIAQDTRVDRASAALRRTEERLIDFLAANRTLAPYSPATAERQRLEREIGIAAQAYTQAVTERESALARELEQTPVLVVVDPVPAELPPVPRFSVFYGLIAALVAAFLVATLLILRELVRRLGGRGDPAARRLETALARVPVLGRVLGARQRRESAASAPVGRPAA